VQGAGGEFTLYQLEFGKYKTSAKNWLEHMGQRVEVTGTAGKKKNKPSIKVDTLSVIARASAETEPQVNAVGAEVELAMVDLFGVEQRLSAYRGRIVVLNFWATYCVPCVKEMPELAAIQNRHAALGVQVIGAAADAVDSKQKVLQFIKTHRVNFPVWLGATAADMEKFGLGSALPGTVIIGRDGKVAAAIRGVFKVEELNKLIETLLAKADREEKQKVAALGKDSKASSVPS
jgi:peroxiredoxin